MSRLEVFGHRVNVPRQPQTFLTARQTPRPKQEIDRIWDTSQPYAYLHSRYVRIFVQVNEVGIRRLSLYPC